jgi:hypothetical protein
MDDENKIMRQIWLFAVGKMNGNVGTWTFRGRRGTKNGAGIARVAEASARR